MERYIGFNRWMFMSLMLTVGVVAQEKDKNNLYPLPQEGWEKVVVDLPLLKKGTSEYRVEFTVGFDMETDLCNPYSLIGEWAEYEVQNSELVYFIASTKGQVVKAMNECPNNKKKSQFVGVKSSFMIHTGQQPLVVYIPEGYQLRYRLWSADKEWNSVVPKDNDNHVKKYKTEK